MADDIYFGESKRLYVVITDFDQFVGIDIPYRYRYVIEMAKTYKLLDLSIITAEFTDYKEYRDFEVECNRQARHKSAGTTIFNELEDIISYFIDRFKLDADKFRRRVRLAGKVYNYS